MAAAIRSARIRGTLRILISLSKRVAPEDGRLVMGSGLWVSFVPALIAPAYHAVKTRDRARLSVSPDFSRVPTGRRGISRGLRELRAEAQWTDCKSASA